MLPVLRRDIAQYLNTIHMDLRFKSTALDIDPMKQRFIKQNFKDSRPLTDSDRLDG